MNVAVKNPRSLRDQAPGEVALIGSFAVDKAEELRLRAMGFCPGRSVRVLRRGRVMVVMVPGTRLALNAELASKITVYSMSQE